jgi:ABC-type sugar transport system ATPase subunit
MSLKVVNLSKRYSNKWVLRDISFEVASGEVYGLFGPSASGKSILLRAIHGVTSLNEGLIFRGDDNVTKTNSSSRDFTLVRTSSESVWQRFLQNKRWVSKGRSESENIRGAIDDSKNVLLLDDPFCAMDPQETEALIEQTREAAKDRGMAVIFASNNFEQVLLACDRVAVIVNGEIKQFGVPQEIYEKPELSVVARVTGRNNLFEARRLSSSKADVPEFHTIDGGHRLFAQRIESSALGALNQNVTLAIRPEQISISFGASFPEDNLLKATVERIQFLGPTTLIGLDANGLKLQALVLRLVGLNIGDECMVGLPPDRIQIFKD